MSNYAWANPINAVREQDDDLTNAIVRIQAQLNDDKAADLHAVILYQQQPRFRVERTLAHSMAAKRRTRMLDWLLYQLRAKLRRTNKEGTELPDDY
jgi:hypothetical protein